LVIAAIAADSPSGTDSSGDAPEDAAGISWTKAESVINSFTLYLCACIRPQIRDCVL
jgi:hypothetical protein